MKSPWDSWAKKYGKSVKATTPNPNIKRIEIASMARFIKPNSSAFEVGCGNGINLFALHDKIKGLELHGCDTSEEMLAVARKEANRRRTQVNLFKANIVDYITPIHPLFDYVICNRVLINIRKKSERKEALLNMLEALRKGGRLILIENFTDTYAIQNKLRNQLGLKSRKWPPFNSFIDPEELDWLHDSAVLEHTENISSIHDLLVYILLAKIYPKHNHYGKWYYNHPIVNYFTELYEKNIGCNMSMGLECGQNSLLIYKKK